MCFSVTVFRFFCFCFFFFNDTATTEIYTLSLHDALPISGRVGDGRGHRVVRAGGRGEARRLGRDARGELPRGDGVRSEEHTSELQSRLHLVCRLLLEKKKKNKRRITLRVTPHGHPLSPQR